MPREKASTTSAIDAAIALQASADGAVSTDPWSISAPHSSVASTELQSMVSLFIARVWVSHRADGTTRYVIPPVSAQVTAPSVTGVVVGLEVMLVVPELVADVVGVEVTLVVLVVEGDVLAVVLGVEVAVLVLVLVSVVVGVDRLHDANVPSLNDCIASFRIVAVCWQLVSSIMKPPKVHAIVLVVISPRL